MAPRRVAPVVDVPETGMSEWMVGAVAVHRDLAVRRCRGWERLSTSDRRAGMFVRRAVAMTRDRRGVSNDPGVACPSAACWVFLDISIIRRRIVAVR